MIQGICSHPSGNLVLCLPFSLLLTPSCFVPVLVLQAITSLSLVQEPEEEGGESDRALLPLLPFTSFDTRGRAEESSAYSRNAVGDFVEDEKKGE